MLHRLAGRLHVAVGQRRHAAADLSGRHVHLDAVVVQHRDDRLGDERIVVVGEHVHEVGDARPGRARLARPAAPAGVTEEAVRAKAGSRRRPRHAEQLSPAASGRCGWPAARWRAGRRRCRGGRTLSVRASTQSAAVQAVLGDVGRLGLQHQLGNVDVGRALDGAHLAIDAQVGHLAHLVGGEQSPGRCPGCSRWRIRLALARGVAASSGVARKIGHMRWAGVRGPALAAAVAAAALLRGLAGLPAQCKAANGEGPERESIAGAPPDAAGGGAVARFRRVAATVTRRFSQRPDQRPRRAARRSCRG